ncbi:hypothetical protein Hypma_002841 [Hypsizygus marmoreus]|uniref:Secreted protein n=1 Tax=Hypsizygus marmoreus TaxID=39966 RepID=A0A369JCM4_HYPMA|nr:hypothetical protein Hypma_002841 [Hypsizygus marmoreus]
MFPVQVVWFWVYVCLHSSRLFCTAVRFLPPQMKAQLFHPKANSGSPACISRDISEPTPNLDRHLQAQIN